MTEVDRADLGSGRHLGEIPSVTHPNFKKTFSNGARTRNVNSVRKIPPRRSDGSDTTMPRIAVTTAAIRIVAITDIPCWAASCELTAAPIPANVAWANDNMPPRPVITTIEQKMIEKIATRIASSSTLSLPWYIT